MTGCVNRDDFGDRDLLALLPLVFLLTLLLLSLFVLTELIQQFRKTCVCWHVRETFCSQPLDEPLSLAMSDTTPHAERLFLVQRPREALPPDLAALADLLAEGFSRFAIFFGLLSEIEVRAVERLGEPEAGGTVRPILDDGRFISCRYFSRSNPESRDSLVSSQLR